MNRWSIQELVAWKNNPRRKPLLLLGARQVGKTWLAREFGRQHYKNVVYVRFDRDVAVSQSFELDYDIARLMDTLQVRSKSQIVPGKTLIILDEIQECPRALTALKYFCEDAPEQHIIAAGSLLGLSVHTGTGFPVGKVDRVYMYPMSFTEFLDATGFESYVDVIRKRDWSTMATFHEKFVELLRQYYFVGGMPAVVQTYAETRNLHAVRRVQDALLEDYRNDFCKHASDAETHYITQIWDSVPEQLSREDKRFVHSDVGAKVRAPLLRGPIRWLEDAALVQTVPRVRKPEMPLSAYKDGAFKMFFLDVGLLAARCRLSPSVILDGNSVFGQFKGALTEQYVQQQLRAESGIAPYYWAAERAQAEVDFLVEMDYQLLPIEVKAELNLQSKSLRSFCKRYRFTRAARVSMSPHAVSTVRISPGKTDPLGHQYTLLDIPLYAIAALPDEMAQSLPDDSAN